MKIEVNDGEVNSAFARLLATGTNPSPWLAIIGRDWAESTRGRFLSGVGPDGKAWAPLSPVTIARRRQVAEFGRRGQPTKHGLALAAVRSVLQRGAGGAQPLRNTGLLMNSITSRVDGNSVEVGTNVVYAKTHQFGAAQGQFGKTRRGGPIPWGRIPARPIFGLSASDKDAVLAVLRDAIERAAEGR